MFKVISKIYVLFLAVLCTTLWIASVLLLTIAALRFQQNIHIDSSGFDGKESTLNNRPNTKNGKLFYQNRKKRNANNVVEFLSNSLENYRVLKNNLTELQCTFVSISCM